MRARLTKGPVKHVVRGASSIPEGRMAVPVLEDALVFLRDQDHLLVFDTEIDATVRVLSGEDENSYRDEEFELLDKSYVLEIGGV